MRVRVDPCEPTGYKTDALCGFVLDGKEYPSGFGDGPKATAILDLAGDLKSEPERVLKTGTAGTIPARRIILTGIGADGSDYDAIRRGAGRIAKEAQNLNLAEFSIVMPDSSACDLVQAVSQTVEGAKLALYAFDEFKTDKAGPSPDLIILAPKTREIARAAREAEKIADAVIFARRLADLPPNECTPEILAGRARKLCAATKLRCRILGGMRLEKDGFGGISAVGRGSANKPRLVIIEYMGGEKNQSPAVLVGKAVTFDTGGISLKPGRKMNEMKFDKSGGCTVLGIMKAVESLRLRRNVVGIIPAVENMPDGDSYRPGDIIRLYNGKTAEILNTDAEGRLILADALAYAEEHYSPSEIVDFATLTGACIVALGNNVAGMISNDDVLAGKMIESSKRTAEEIWRLPLNDDYSDMIKSDVADMKNIGIENAAGTIVAAAFLKNAVEKTPWVHMDIAGVAWTQAGTRQRSYKPKGATGFGIRLAVDHLRDPDTTP